MPRVFDREINAEKNSAVYDALCAVLTRKGSGVGAGHPIAFSMLFSSTGRLVARDNANTLHSGTSIEPLANYLVNNAFQEYLHQLRLNKKSLHELHADDVFGPVLASSYRFKQWLITIRSYDAEGVSKKGHVSTVNTLIVLSPLRGLSIDALDQMIDSMEEECARILTKFPRSTQSPTVP